MSWNILRSLRILEIETDVPEGEQGGITKDTKCWGAFTLSMGCYKRTSRRRGQKTTPELLSITAWTTMFRSRRICAAVHSHYVGVPLPKHLVISYGPKYLIPCSVVVSAQYHAHKRVPKSLPPPLCLCSGTWTQNFVYPRQVICTTQHLVNCFLT